jgi:hypothetical protein
MISIILLGIGGLVLLWIILKKEKLRLFGLLVAAHAGGVLLGTAASGLLFDMPLGLSVFILAPLEMSIGIPMVFDSSVFVGCFVVAGLLISIACFVWGMKKYSSWALCGLFLGSTLWSLGNVLVFWKFMSA